MKSGKYIAVVAVLASGLSLSAFAKDKNETRITLSHSVQVGMTQLKPGDYKLQWDGSGSNVQVKFLQGKEVVATVPAKLGQAKNPQGVDAIETSDVSNVSTLNRIDFARGKQSMDFTQATASDSASGQQ